MGMTEPPVEGTFASEPRQSNVENAAATHSSESGPPQTNGKLVIRIPAPQVSSEGKTEEIEDVSDEETSTNPQHTFCPQLYRDKIITMMERHYCAHPLIPGYAAPSRDGIRRWAVQQMYSFCQKNELPEVWAYLWENWYRKGRWELWARSAHVEIPILKTTMMVEAQ